MTPSTIPFSVIAASRSTPSGTIEKSIAVSTKMLMTALINYLSTPKGGFDSRLISFSKEVIPMLTCTECGCPVVADEVEIISVHGEDFEVCTPCAAKLSPRSFDEAPVQVKEPDPNYA